VRQPHLAFGSSANNSKCKIGNNFLRWANNNKKMLPARDSALMCCSNHQLCYASPPREQAAWTPLTQPFLYARCQAPPGVISCQSPDDKHAQPDSCSYRCNPSLLVLAATGTRPFIFTSWGLFCPKSSSY